MIEQRREDIIKRGDLPDITVKEQLNLLEELSQSGLGKFLIENQAIDANWTYRLTTGEIFYPVETATFNNRLEYFLYHEAPIMLATRERAQIFLDEVQKVIKQFKYNSAEKVEFANIPCGYLGALLHADYSELKNFKLVGIDIDDKALLGAKTLATKLKLDNHIELIKQDAWKLYDHVNRFHLVVSNGLNIYVDDNKTVELYKNFYNSLKSGGTLIVSACTTQEDWDMSKINLKNLQLQKHILVDTIDAKWKNHYRTVNQTIEQLVITGFKKENVRVIYDKAKIFPTFVVTK